jgi:tetratricopeptide (TPR) repeat protein
MKNIVFSLSFLLAAVSAFSQASADSATQFFNKGVEEKNARRYMVAYQQFQKAIERQPNEVQYHKEAGFTSLELRKYDQARMHFEKVYQLDKNDDAAIAQLAQINFALRRWPAAIQYAEVMKQKTLKGYNYLLGRSHYEQENYGEAYKYLQAAGKEDPANAEIPYIIGRSFVDMNNYKMAVQFFEQAIAKDSTKANWLYETGLTYFAIPDAKRAIQYFELAIAKGYKTSNDVMENLSNAYIEAGQPQRGIEMMKNLLEKKPADMNLLWSIAEAHYKTGKYSEAIEYWDRMLYYDKANAKPLYMIGLSYQKKGEKEKGQQLCDKAIEMDPSLKNLKQKKEMPAF